MQKNLCGPNIRRLRLAQNLTLNDLEAKLLIEHGVALDRTNIGRIENGSRHVSDIELALFANLLDVPLEELLPMDAVKKRTVSSSTHEYNGHSTDLF